MFYVFYVVMGISVISSCCSFPVVLNTWPWPSATDAAWAAMSASDSPFDAVEKGCTQCEVEQCDGTVGYGGSPDENGETTLDAMMMDCGTMNIGAVGSLRRIKNAIGVARRVLENTEHTLLVGELATHFAIEMGFSKESLSTNSSTDMWKLWKSKNCQPNFRIHVEPDPKESCGPYKPKENIHELGVNLRSDLGISHVNHDTIGMIAINKNGHIAVGTSTNGVSHKVPGRVGDSPIAGAGAFGDNDVGAAVATGDGDIMMRLLPTYQAVESMRNGLSPVKAVEDALIRILKFYPTFSGALLAINLKGEVGAACTGFPTFPFCVRDNSSNQTVVNTIKCI